jgi:hypothetical protein
MSRLDYIVGQRVRLISYLAGANLTSGALGTVIKVFAMEATVEFSEFRRATLPFGLLEPDNA